MSRHQLHPYAYYEAARFLACCLAAGALGGVFVQAARLALTRP
jgi:hypothetical protein